VSDLNGPFLSGSVWRFKICSKIDFRPNTKTGYSWRTAFINSMKL